MDTKLLKLSVKNFKTESGWQQSIPLSYQLFGKPLHTAPVVLVNHALTGNSNVAGKNGWWSDLIGEGKCIDTSNYTILAFNIPGNGYDGFVVENYKDFVARDVAKIFLFGLEKLGIKKLFAIIGGSLGGGIAWEMAVLKPEVTQHLIPVATDWKSTDWLIANCQIQERILLNSKDPVRDARMHAMLTYRTPESFKERFQRTTNQELQVFNVESWLLHHGEKLQERFQLSAYQLMNQLLKTIDVTRGRKELFQVLESVKANIHIIGVDSDLFFSPSENRETFKQLAQANANVTYGEIRSKHGHDAFLMEFEQLEKLLSGIFSSEKKSSGIKVLKFGGKSLANGEGFSNMLNLIEQKFTNDERIAIVVSARGNATDDLEEMLYRAAQNKEYSHLFEAFKNYQKGSFDIDFSSEFNQLEKLFEGVRLLGDFSPKTKDQVLAFGELLSAKLVTSLLKKRGLSANLADARQFIVTDANYGNAQPFEGISRDNLLRYFEKHPHDTVHIITGFIGATKNNETTTLGRNGSNYTAALIANFLDADEFQNYTHVDGIFTADPSLVKNAKRIHQISYDEANELANFGANILHAKTIIPLIEKNIPLRILNTFNPKAVGTLITASSSNGGIKSLSVLDDVALLHLEGRGLLGKTGVDARIFGCLGRAGVSVSIISQGSSERGIGLVVAANDAEKAKRALEQEFEGDVHSKDIHTISYTSEVSVISIIGQDMSTFHKPYNALIKNGIVPILFNNTVTGKNVSLVVHKNQLHKALNVVHGEIFWVVKKVNIAIFGHGTVGGTLIGQILDSAKSIEERKKVKLNIFAVSNSKKMLLNENGIDDRWREKIAHSATFANVDEVIAFAKEHHFENLIAVDNTASKEFVENYPKLIDEGFDLVSSNKIANTLGFSFYKSIRQKLESHQKQYLYETNVGAGLPLIDTIRLLHLSGENITRIRGVFSGTLSYLFNRFSLEEKPFSVILGDAIQKGFTEPDPREDLNGNDVGRKLLILARELDLQNEFEEVNIENLVPQHLREHAIPQFLSNLKEFDGQYAALKTSLKPDEVLRYVGDLHGDLQQDKGVLDVKLMVVPKNSSLGQVTGADSIFEIYTESYGDRPIVIQGAGAGAAVTARGVFGDILKLTERG